MLDVFRRSLGTRSLTTEYPEAPEAAPPAYRGQVQLDPGRCTGDAACARVCPSQAISVRATGDLGWSWELSDARCVFCGLCAEACPTRAIVLSNEFELATRSESELITHVTFRAGERGSPA